MPWSQVYKNSFAYQKICFLSYKKRLKLLKYVVTNLTKIPNVYGFINPRPTKPFFVTWFTKGGGYHPL